jgi:hypothetical protein
MAQVSAWLTKAQSVRNKMFQAQVDLTGRSVDGVDVRRERTRIHNRVNSCKTNATRTLHAPEGGGSAKERGGRQGSQELGHVGGLSKFETV